jgi:hypothetical protein
VEPAGLKEFRLFEVDAAGGLGGFAGGVEDFGGDQIYFKAGEAGGFDIAAGNGG